MPSNSKLRRVLNSLFGMLMGFYISAPVYAFAPSDAPLLSSGSVTPNVMLQVDDSGSMDTLSAPLGSTKH
jgi:type IV pilus assembly protein PilY1